jgi:hypothetical protein
LATIYQTGGNEPVPEVIVTGPLSPLEPGKLMDPANANNTVHKWRVSLLKPPDTCNSILIERDVDWGINPNYCLVGAELEAYMEADLDKSSPT